MSSVKDRIKQIMAVIRTHIPTAGETDLANISGADASTVGQWLDGTNKNMCMDYALNIQRELGFHLVWIVGGIGPKFVAGYDSSRLFQSGNYAGLPTPSDVMGSGPA